MLPEQIRQANRTSRNWKTTAIDKIIRNLISKNDLVLDFGAGKNAIQALRLQREGYKVTAYDFGDNLNSKIHDPDALDKKYDVIYASNVINVQSSISMLHETLSQIVSVLKPSGVFIANYPKDPRMLGLNEEKMLKELKRHFTSIERYPNTKNIIWVMRKI